MKNKHGSNVGITLGTVINYNILQHYSISITTLLVYFTHYSIYFSSLHVTVHLLFAFLHRFAHTLLFLCLFPTFNLLLLYFSYTFFVTFHYRSTITIPLTFPVYINNLTLVAIGCEGRLSIARFAPSPASLSSCCSPSA